MKKFLILLGVVFVSILFASCSSQLAFEEMPTPEDHQAIATFGDQISLIDVAVHHDRVCLFWFTEEKPSQNFAFDLRFTHTYDDVMRGHEEIPAHKAKTQSWDRSATYVNCVEMQDTGGEWHLWVTLSHPQRDTDLYFRLPGREIEHATGAALVWSTDEVDKLIDINDATGRNLIATHQVDGYLAKKIVEFRQQYGPYNDKISLLMQGVLTLEAYQRLYDHITVGDAAEIVEEPLEKEMAEETAESTAEPEAEPVVEATEEPAANPQVSTIQPGWHTFSNSNIAIHKMIFDNQGMLWTINQSGGVVRWDLEAHTYEKWDVSDGMPGNNARDIHISPNGEIWVLFPRALSIFDGSQWHHDLDWGPNEFVLSYQEMAYALDGTIWLRSYRDVAAYDGQEWQIHADLGFNESEQLNSIIVLANGDVLLASSDGISRYDGKRWQLEKGTDDLWVWQLLLTDSGDLWAVAQLSALANYQDERAALYYENGEWQILDDVNGAGAYRVHEMAEGVIVLSKERELAVYQSSEDFWVTDEYIQNEYGDAGAIWAMATDGENQFCYASQLKGVFCFDLVDVEYSLYQTDDISNPRQSRNFAISPEGDIWVNSFWNAIRYDGHTWAEIVPAKDGYGRKLIADAVAGVWSIQNSYEDQAVIFSYLKDDEVQLQKTITEEYQAYSSVVSTGEFGLFLVQEDNDLIYFDGDEIKKIGEWIGAPRPNLAMDSHGSLWVGDSNAIYTWRDGDWKRFATVEDFGIDRIRQFRVDDHDRVWVIGPGKDSSQVQIVYADNSEFTSIPSPAGMTNSGPQAQFLQNFAIAPNGDIWAGSWCKGVFHYDGSTWTQYTTADGLAFDCVNDIQVAPDGVVWAGHQEGGMSYFISKESADRLNQGSKGNVAAYEMVNIPGSAQEYMGCSSEWQPDCEESALELDDGLWRGSFDLPAGEYEVKIAVNGSWDINYGEDGERGGPNISYVLDKDGRVSFVFDPHTNRLDIRIVDSSDLISRLQVVSSGDLSTEYLLIEADSEVNLDGWQLEIEHGPTYTFPAVRIFPGSQIRLYTRDGENTPGALFWRLNEVVWVDGVGDAILKDAQGIPRARYSFEVLLTFGVEDGGKHTTQTVEASQGAELVLDSGARLTIPKNALNGDGEVTLINLGDSLGGYPELPEGVGRLGDFYDIQTDGLELLENQVVYLSLPFDPGKLPSQDEEEIAKRLFVGIPKDDYWMRVTSSKIDFDNHTLTIPMSSLTDPQLMWVFNEDESFEIRYVRPDYMDMEGNDLLLLDEKYCDPTTLNDFVYRALNGDDEIEGRTGAYSYWTRDESITKVLIWATVTRYPAEETAIVFSGLPLENVGTDDEGFFTWDMPVPVSMDTSDFSENYSTLIDIRYKAFDDQNHVIHEHNYGVQFVVRLDCEDVEPTLTPEPTAVPLSQSLVGARAWVSYHREMEAADGSYFEEVTVTRYEEIIEAVDDVTVRVEVTYEGDGGELITEVGKPWHYHINLETGEIEYFEGQDLTETLITSRQIHQYQVSGLEKVEGWEYIGEGTRYRDLQTYLTMSFDLIYEIYDPDGNLWGTTTDKMEFIELRLP